MGYWSLEGTREGELVVDARIIGQVKVPDFLVFKYYNDSKLFYGDYREIVLCERNYGSVEISADALV